MKQTWLRYSPEFKDQALRRAEQDGVPQAAKDLRLSANQLYATLMSKIYIASDQTAYGLELDRTFNEIGQQTLWQTTEWWLDSSYRLPWSSAGFLIEGRGTNMTGVIYQHGAQQLEVCPPLGGSGYESTPAPMPYTCPSFSIPSEWKVIGAMANGIVPGG